MWSKILKFFGLVSYKTYKKAINDMTMIMLEMAVFIASDGIEKEVEKKEEPKKVVKKKAAVKD